MNVLKRIGAGLKGFGMAIVAIPKDIRRYLAMKRM